YDNKWLLLGLAVVIAAAGIAASVAVYAKGKARPVEPRILADGWRYDAAISGVVGGPGRAAFQAVADVDARIVDGAVNGVGIEVRALSGLLRRVQNGFVRSYAAIISIAVVAMLAWFLLRGVL
ncbi:MAG: NADH-quinone oxidoreductase subunit L, partial [Actinobacteria bacterium]|nr:NADH-quinone oxidoreductase subunit L [Actinomycetota bacterium]